MIDIVKNLSTIDLGEEGLPVFEKLIFSGKEMASSVTGTLVENLPKEEEILLQVFMDSPFSSFSNILSMGQLAVYIKNLLKKKFPWLYSEWKFWDNMDKFLNSGILTDDDKQKLVDRLSNEKNKEDIGKEIIALVAKANNDKKLAYILNTTKALANSKINLSYYFRICHVVFNTFEDDLQFLNAHINENSIAYSIEVNGLMASGLAYDRGINENDAPSYSFNEFAKLVSEYALKDNSEKKLEEFNLSEPPRTSFLTEDNIATDEEFNEMMNDVWNNNSK